jgi:hypothetical protein
LGESQAQQQSCDSSDASKTILVTQGMNPPEEINLFAINICD